MERQIKEEIDLIFKLWRIFKHRGSTETFLTYQCGWFYDGSLLFFFVALLESSEKIFKNLTQIFVY